MKNVLSFTKKTDYPADLCDNKNRPIFAILKYDSISNDYLCKRMRNKIEDSIEIYKIKWNQTELNVPQFLYEKPKSGEKYYKNSILLGGTFAIGLVGSLIVKNNFYAIPTALTSITKIEGLMWVLAFAGIVIDIAIPALTISSLIGSNTLWVLGVKQDNKLKKHEIEKDKLLKSPEIKNEIIINKE